MDVKQFPAAPGSPAAPEEALGSAAPSAAELPEALPAVLLERPAPEGSVEQLAAARRRLVSQMEVLRKENNKLQARQKQMALEHTVLTHEQQAMEDQRGALAALQRDLEQQKLALAQQAADLDTRAAELQELLERKERYLHEVAQVHQHLQDLRVRHDQARAQLEGFAGKAQEMTRLEAQKDRWLSQLHAARRTVAQLVQTQRETLCQQQDLGRHLRGLARRTPGAEPPRAVIETRTS